MCSENDKINELVDMLDKLVSDGSGHINVDAEAMLGGSGSEMTVSTGRSLDCGTGNMACCVPTLHKGIDE